VRDALIVIDMQNDFVRDTGALSVPQAGVIIPAIRKLVTVASGKGAQIFFTMDWHEPNDIEFAMDKWPKHCVRGTKGAEIVRELAFLAGNKEILKNSQYDKFPDTGLKAMLQEKGAKRLFLAGVATEYCIKYTALGALKQGFEVFIVSDAIKPIDKRHGAMVLEELERRGARLVSSEEALAEFNRNI